MDFNLIAAMTPSGVIGQDDDIPWHIPEDLKHFKKVTTNGYVVMGNTTFKSLPYKALSSNRTFLVLSSTKRGSTIYDNARVIYFNDIESILKYCEGLGNASIYIAGGSKIYDLFIDYCNRAIITLIHNNEIVGNKFFPIDKLNQDFNIIYIDELKTSGNFKYNIFEYVRK